MKSQSFVIETDFAYRDRVRLEGTIESDQVLHLQVQAKGCLSFLRALRDYCEQLKKTPLNAVKLDKEGEHWYLLLREVHLRLLQKWEFPYSEEELCHCRVIATKVVDSAVLNGAQTVNDVARLTSAGTGCGTCRKDSEKIIAYRRRTFF